MDWQLEHECLQAQIQEMLKYKWLKSEQLGYDVGEIAIYEWIRLFAAKFRNEWEKNNGICNNNRNYYINNNNIDNNNNCYVKSD